MVSALLALGTLVACSERDDTLPRRAAELQVYAAASLRDVLLELEPGLEAILGADLLINLGSSGDLARQIVAGAPADVFLSADEREMDRVAVLGLLEASTRRDFLSNHLVVVEPLEDSADWKSIFTQPFDPGQLAGGRIERLSLANVETVPAGRYAKAWLEARGVWSSVAKRVLPAIDVRAATAAVESGGAQAGIVYRTDASRSARVSVVFEVPRSEGPAIVYPAAALRRSADSARARRMLELLSERSARAIFERHGFETLPRAR